MTKTTNTHHRIRRALGGVAVAALLAGAAVTIAPQADGTIGFGGTVAEAAPGGNGKGNGNGAANGNGGNSANAGAQAGASVDAGANASTGSNGNGNAFGHTASFDTDADGDIESAHPSELGRLNAAHASATARKNAAPNSAVGQIASYEHEVQEGNLEGAAASFAEAANKDIVEPVVHAVNELLGIDDAPVRDDEVADNDDDGVNDDDDGFDLGGLFDGITVHDTEGEIAARANGTWDPANDGDTGAPEGDHDS